jgi:hypothetical protein
MLNVTFLAVLLSASGPPADVLQVSARLEAEKLQVGEEYGLVVEVRVKEGWSASKAGIPKPMIQIRFPKSAQTSEHVLREQRDLQKPFEQLVEGDSLRYEFKLKRRPSDGDHFAFNVLAYVSRDGDDKWFVRKRYELPLAVGAAAKEISADESAWGRSRELQIGDKARLFKLPRADGSKLVLRKYIGEKNVIVTTYRAHW